MRRIAPRLPRIQTLTLALGLAAAWAPHLAGRALAQDDLVPPEPMVRKFPQGQFCALPVRLAFVTPVDAVSITFEAQVFVDDGFGTLVWTNQSIDNVTLATSAQVLANFGPPPEFSSSENCYIGDPQPTQYFYFNRAGLTFALKELCDDDPAARGWDMTEGGYFNALDSAPRDVENDTDPNGGSLGLGQDSPTPTGSEIARTSIAVNGLTIGESYDLCAWWNANFVRFPHDVTYLTVTVRTLTGTPVARRSWGSIKSSYR